MSNKKRGQLGIICAVCLVLVVLGAIAGWQIAEIYTATSNVYGAPDTVIEGGLGLSDDENMFFKYTVDALSFEVDTYGRYYQTIVFEKADYDSTAYDYEFYLNGQKANSTALAGSIQAKLDYLFYLPDGAEYNAPLEIELKFLNDRSELTLRVNSRTTTGYLNQMTRSGLNISVVAVEASSFELEGTGSIEGLVIDKPVLEF